MPLNSIHEARSVFRRAYLLLREAQGHQKWWPADSPFEVCVGAILTQNTAWTNVRRAIGNLKEADHLDPHRLWALSSAGLARLIRPAGYFRVKARRLRAFLKVLVQEHGGRLHLMLSGPTAKVRERLLAIHGIGPETADSILLYAGEHLSFVIDAYTKRIFQRHEWCGERATYEEVQTLCARALAVGTVPKRLDYWRDFHAQLVGVGNTHCRPRTPRCETCPLRSLLPKKVAAR